jgi:hypothetical protein
MGETPETDADGTAKPKEGAKVRAASRHAVPADQPLLHLRCENQQARSWAARCQQNQCSAPFFSVCSSVWSLTIISICAHSPTAQVSENLGQILLGERIRHSPYEVRMREDVYCRPVCMRKYDFEDKKSRSKFKKLNQAIKKVSRHRALPARAQRIPRLLAHRCCSFSLPRCLPSFRFARKAQLGHHGRVRTQAAP